MWLYKNVLMVSCGCVEELDDGKISQGEEVLTSLASLKQLVLAGVSK